MSRIVIKDLPESIDLDRDAMLAISGGARMRGRHAFPAPSIVRTSRIVSYPASVAAAQPNAGKSRKPTK